MYLKTLHHFAQNENLHMKNYNLIPNQQNRVLGKYF